MSKYHPKYANNQVKHLRQIDYQQGKMSTCYGQSNNSNNSICQISSKICNQSGSTFVSNVCRLPTGPK
jgi:hypothetical protein